MDVRNTGRHFFKGINGVCIEYVICTCKVLWKPHEPLTCRDQQRQPDQQVKFGICPEIGNFSVIRIIHDSF